MAKYRLSRRDLSQRFFMVPAVLLMAFLFVYPLFYLFYTSLWRKSLVRPDRTAFVGLSNYAKALTDPRFIASFRITLVYAVLVVVFTIVVGLIVSVVLNLRRRGRRIVKGGNIIRTILLLPAIMAPSATGVFFRAFLFDYDFGVANHYLVAAGLGRVPWLLDPVTALLTVVAVQVWIRGPYSMLIFDAAIRQIPHSYFEAAMMDGASVLKQITHITIPILKPQILFAIVFQTTFAFRQFDIAFMLTGGGPGDSTRLMTLFIYDEALRRFNFGYSMAQSVILIVLVTVFVLTAIRLIGKAEVTR